MADNIVGNLFGVDLTTAQQARDRQSLADDMALAQLSPEARSSFYAMQGGRAIGKGINSLFGLEDPVIAKQRQENEILSSIDAETAKDPYKLATAVFEKARAAGLNDMANHAYQQMQVAQEKQVELGYKTSQTSKNIAEATKAQREQLDTFARTLMANNIMPGSPEYQAQMNAYIKKQTNIAEPNVTAENKAEQAKLNEFITKLGPAAGNNAFLQWKQDNEIALKKAGKTDINLPSEGSKTEDVARIEKSWKDRVGPAEEKLSNINSALSLANLAQTNPSASNLLDTEIAKLAQDGKLSNKDVDLVRSGNASVFQKLGDKVGIFLSGKQTDLTLKDKIAVIKAYEAGAAKKYNSESERTANVWGTTPIGKETIKQLRAGREKYVVGGGMSEQLDPNYEYVTGSDGKTYKRAKAK